MIVSHAFGYVPIKLYFLEQAAVRTYSDGSSRKSFSHAVILNAVEKKSEVAQLSHHLGRQWQVLSSMGGRSEIHTLETPKFQSPQSSFNTALWDSAF